MDTDPPADDTARVVLVTGGLRGIGAGIVGELAARGCRVGCGYRHGEDSAAALAETIGPTVAPVHYELGSATSAQAAVDTVVGRWGRLDGLVLNAGEWRGGRLDVLDPDEWAGLVARSTAGNAQLTRVALPCLRAGASPSVVLVSSVVGQIGHAGDTAYASAKAAMVGFARSLAKEVGRDGIRVNVLAPGFVDSDMTAEVSTRARERIEGRAVLGRFGTAAEIARAAVFLSEDATYCTGTVLTVDGGWSL